MWNKSALIAPSCHEYFIDKEHDKEINRNAGEQDYDLLSLARGLRYKIVQIPNNDK